MIFRKIEKLREKLMGEITGWKIENVTDLSESQFELLLFEFQIDVVYTKDDQLFYICIFMSIHNFLPRILLNSGLEIAK